MASLRCSQSGKFIVCFRFNGRQYQRALKTSDHAKAKAWKGRIEDRIFRLESGERRLPPGVEPGDFIVRGRAALRRQEANAPVPVAASLSLAVVIEKYLAAQFTKAPSSVSTERTHLNNLKSVLGSLVDRPCEEITHGHLTTFLQQRRKTRAADTVKKERMTVRHLFAWACAQGFLTKNPARLLVKIQDVEDRNHRRDAALGHLFQRALLRHLREAILGSVLTLSTDRFITVATRKCRRTQRDTGGCDWTEGQAVDRPERGCRRRGGNGRGQCPRGLRLGVP
jgi:hypothetical protein